MAKKVLTILIGNEVTKVCEVSYHKKYEDKGIRVYNSISFPTPENVIEDGYIKNKEAFGEQLRSQLRAAKIKSNKAIFSIVSSKIANREVIIPLVKDSRIMDIVKMGSNDYFPVDMKDYILSYIILEKKKSDRRDKALAKKQAKLDARLAKKQEKADRKSNKNSLERIKNSSSARLLFNEDKQPQKEVIDNSAAKQEAKDKKSKKHIRLSVYAVPASLVKNYYNFADLMDFEVISIDYSGNSSYQMLKRQANEGENVFVQLNEQDTVISILHDDVLLLQRTIGYGVSMLAETVMEQKCFHAASEEKAMELLQNQNLLNAKEAVKPVLPVTSWAADEAAAASEANISPTVNKEYEEYMAKKAVTESLSFVTSSISRMLDYYKNNHRASKFQSIYLSGMGIRIQGIDQLFSDEIGIDNRKLEKLYTVSSKKKAKEYRSHPSEFMACVGSVIKPVDFIPVELVQHKQKIQAVVASVFLILLCLFGSASVCYFAYEDYLSAKVENVSALAEQRALPSSGNVKEEYEKASGRLNNLKEMEASMQGDDKVEEVISSLGKKLLSNSYIQSIQFSESGVVMNVVIADTNYGPNTLVAKLLMQLKTIDLFKDVQDSNMAVSEDGEVSLTVTCTYK